MTEQPVATLRIEQGPHRGETLELFRGQSLTFGRSLDSDCFIPDETVSRNHAEFHADDIRVFVRSFGSNGIIINDKRIVESESQMLEHGAKVEIGPCKLSVEMPHLAKTFVLYETMIKPINAMKTMFMPSTRRMDAGEAASVESGGRGASASPKSGHSFVDKYFQSTMSKALLVMAVLLFLIIIAGDLMGPDTPPDGKGTAESGGAAGDSVFQVIIPPATVAGEIPPDTLAEARKRFKRAEKRFLDRALLDRNVFDSIQTWQAGISMLGKYRQRGVVDDYLDALSKSKEACRYLNQQFELWKKEIIIKEKQGHADQANDVVQTVLRSVPDMHHFAYRWAKKYERRLAAKIR